MKDPIVLQSRGDIARLKQRLNGYLGLWRNIYVGASTNIAYRWDRHEEDDIMGRYESFFVLAVTPKRALAVEAEAMLIKHAEQSNFDIELGNHPKGQPGSGLPKGRPAYAIYILVGDRKQRRLPQRRFPAWA